jgi:crotonobetainyl-CoA:carnitine CoA-transferase CaiB-like acyl-CoA transferase
MFTATGYGETGPNAPLPGFGKVAEGLSGIVPLTGSPMAKSVFVGFSLADTSVALFGLFAINLALYTRDISGGAGAHIDLALYEPLLRMLDCQCALTDRGHPDQGQRNANDPYAWGVAEAANEQCFLTLHCATGEWLIVLIPNRATAAGICTDLLRQSGAASDIAIFRDSCARWAETRTPVEVRNALVPLGAEMVPVFDGAAIARHAYFRARGDVIDVDTEIGTIVVPGPYPKDPVHIASMRRFRPAALGADNDEVFGGKLGLSQDEIQSLKDRGVI